MFDKKKIDVLAPKNVKEKVISRNGSKEIIYLEKDRKKNPTIEDVFVFGFDDHSIFNQYNRKRYKTFGAIFSPDVLKDKDLDETAKLFFSAQEKTDIRKLRTTTQQKDGMFAFSSENKKNIERWIKKAKKSDAKAIKIVLDMHGDENGYLDSDVSRELLYLLNKIASDKDLCKKNIEIVNKACYAADKFEENTMISRYNPQIFHITHKTTDLMKILTNFARKVKKKSPQTNIVYTSNFSKTEPHGVIRHGDNVIKNEKLQNFIYHANALNHYHKYDPEKKCFIPISKTLDSFYQKAIYDNNYLNYLKSIPKNNNKSYKKLMINFNVLTSLNRRLLEENKPDNELKTFLEEIESECVKKIPNNDTINFFLPRINVFLNRYRNSLRTKTKHHIKNLRSYELFFPEDIVKEMQNAKQRKNDLLLGNKKDVEILNDLNKINPSNKMNENKKNSNHIKEQEYKRTNAYINIDNYIKEQKRKKTNAYINLDNHMLGKSNDNQNLS